MKDTADIRQSIVDIGRWLYEKNLIVAGDGNISVRLENGTFLCTPSGLCKGRMSSDELIIVDIDGARIEGDLKPSSEIKMHLMVYRQRPDVHAVVHAHPPTATGFACAGEPLNKALLPEVILTLGNVPIAPYGTPSTAEVADGIRELITVHDGLLLANHGAITVGPDLMTAYNRMETLEHFARITLVTRMLGRETLLTSERVQELRQITDAAGTTPLALRLGSKPLTRRPADDLADKLNDPVTMSRKELVELIEDAFERIQNLDKKSGGN